MNILYISKYAATEISERPTRQYFLSKCLTESGNTVMLVYSNSNGLKQNDQPGNEIVEEKGNSLFVLKLNGPYITMGMSLKRIWSWVYFEFQLFKNSYKIKCFQPEVIIVSSLSLLTFIYGVYLKKHLKRPLVIEVRDLYPLTLTEIGGWSVNNPFVKIMACVEKFGYKNADLIYTSLEHAESYFETIKGSPVKFKWIPMGINLTLYERFPDSATSELIEKVHRIKTAGNFIIGYSGSIGKANALKEVLRLSVDPEVINRRIHIVIIGNGPLLDYYKENYSMGEISFFDSIPKKYLILVLKEFDLLINTWLDKDIYRFGISPNKWIEYMYSGRPVLLAFNGISKIFDEAKCGWQVPAEQYEVLKEEIIRIHSLPEEILTQRGTDGKHYLLTRLNYKKLSEELEKSLEECTNVFLRDS